MADKRWLYKGGGPNSLAKILNNGWALIHGLGIAPNYLVTLEVPGRQSGKIIRFPLVMLTQGQERHLVSMLGEQANWVRNLRAAGGKAVLKHGAREEILLEDVDISQRAALIKAYLQVAPGARPHIPVEKDAPLEAFEQIAPIIPVFKITQLSYDKKLGMNTSRKNYPILAFFFYPLLILLVLLGLGGLGGGAAMLADPTGAGMGLSLAMLENLPIADFALPGLFLIAVMGVAPLVIGFGLLKRLPWAWAAALTQGIVLILWIGLQIVLWGAPMFIQVLYIAWGAVIVGLCLAPGVRVELRKPPEPVLQREPEIADLEAQFTKETDPELAKNRQVSNTLRSGRG